MGDWAKEAVMSEGVPQPIGTKLEALREAIGSSDAALVGRVAYALKGSSANMGGAEDVDHLRRA